VIVVGLTGGIGSGKSTVSEALARRGAVIVDADAIVKELQRAGAPVFDKMVERFGPDIIGADGELDRQRIAGLVFNDPDALKALNGIVHPAVGIEIRRRVAEQADTDNVVVLDIPLLAEGEGRERYPTAAVIVVDTPVEVAVARLVEHRGLDEADARARIARQVSRDERRQIADRIIDNSGDRAHLEGQIEDLWAWLVGLPHGAWVPSPVMHKVRGVVARSKGAPVSIETVLVPDPGPGEALVRVQACGVCHTDLHYREGGINDDFPFLLGHEAAGVVEAVGPDVTGVAPGDYVILNWRAVCGQCRSCLRGKPWYCFATHNATQKMTLEDGTVLSPALGIGAFVEKTLVAAGQCTKIDPQAPATAAGLLGCGVMAGIGAAINTGGVGRGDTVAVFGCGGVGDAAIAGARLAGARTIIAVDIDDRKLDWARSFGATHTVNSRTADPVQAIKDLTEGNGVDVAIEAVGKPETYRQAFEARDLAGTVVLVGVPRPDMELTLPFIEVFGRGGQLKSSWYGDCLPSRDFPMLIELYLQGRLDLDRFVSETISLDDVEAAFHKMEKGDVLRSVVLL
jgi:S-(hydroxymethyl)mycothiol dehydrogenase